MVDSFRGAATRIVANHLALIRSILIDSGDRRALRNVICAKLFRCVCMFSVNNVNAKHNACSAEILSSRHARRKLPSLQKPLFHRTFFNFSNMHLNERRALFSVATNSSFDRVIALRRVTSCAHTRFVAQ
jgi:hypothetical protein